MSALVDFLKANVSNAPNQYANPVWDGPESDTKNGGITFSLLSRYLVCEERFRLYVMHGLRPNDQFTYRIEYGMMWHLCEEQWNKHGAKEFLTSKGKMQGWEISLLNYTLALCKKYPTAQIEIDKCYNCCQTQFPIYVKFWQRHPDMPGRKQVGAEKEFNVLYTLPSGRSVRLRGKRDGEDLVDNPKGNNNGYWMQENKAKGDINTNQIERQLKFDLQTMIYYISFLLEGDNIKKIVRGVRYNVVRRPLSGGKGTIQQYKATKKKAAESSKDFYNRLAGIMDGTSKNSPGPEHFFFRVNVHISKMDVYNFTNTCLNPILENLIDDYEWWKYCHESKDNRSSNTEQDGFSVWDYMHRHEMFPHHMKRNYRYPFGVYNSIDEKGYHDLDEFLETQTEIGLQRATNLFPELGDT